MFNLKLCEKLQNKYNIFTNTLIQQHNTSATKIIIKKTHTLFLLNLLNYSSNCCVFKMYFIFDLFK